MGVVYLLSGKYVHNLQLFLFLLPSSKSVRVCVGVFVASLDVHRNERAFGRIFRS